MLAIRDADAIEEAGEAVIEVVLPPPGQLAKAWENNALIRQQMRDGRKLLSWPSRVTIGAASQQALVLNRTVIMILVEQWGAVCAEPKSVPIKWMRDEVKELHCMFNQQTDAVDMVDSRLQPLMDLMVQIWGSPDELHDPAHDAIADAPLADLVPVPAIADTPLPDLVPAPSIEDASAPEEVAAEGPPGPVVDAYEVFFATPSDDENCPEADDDGNPDVFPEVAQVDQSVQETDVSDCPEQQEPVADEPVQAEASDFLEQPEPMDVGASGATDQQDLVVPGLVEHSVLEKTDHACWPPCESTSKRARLAEKKLARQNSASVIGDPSQMETQPFFSADDVASSMSHLPSHVDLTCSSQPSLQQGLQGDVPAPAASASVELTPLGPRRALCFDLDEAETSAIPEPAADEAKEAEAPIPEPSGPTADEAEAPAIPEGPATEEAEEAEATAIPEPSDLAAEAKEAEAQAIPEPSDLAAEAKEAEAAEAPAIAEPSDLAAEAKEAKGRMAEVEELPQDGSVLGFKVSPKRGKQSADDAAETPAKTRKLESPNGKPADAAVVPKAKSSKGGDSGEGDHDDDAKDPFWKMVKPKLRKLPDPTYEVYSEIAFKCVEVQMRRGQSINALLQRGVSFGQAFVAIFLLVSWLAPASFASQQVDIIEFFAGLAVYMMLCAHPDGAAIFLGVECSTYALHPALPLEDVFSAYPWEKWGEADTPSTAHLQGHCRMSFESLPTRRGSTDTLARGLELASAPLPEMLHLKEEPQDEEEAELRREMQATAAAVPEPSQSEAARASPPKATAAAVPEPSQCEAATASPPKATAAAVPKPSQSKAATASPPKATAAGVPKPSQSKAATASPPPKATAAAVLAEATTASPSKATAPAVPKPSLSEAATASPSKATAAAVPKPSLAEAATASPSKATAPAVPKPSLSKAATASPPKATAAAVPKPSLAEAATASPRATAPAVPKPSLSEATAPEPPKATAAAVPNPRLSEAATASPLEATAAVPKPSLPEAAASPPKATPPAAVPEPNPPNAVPEAAKAPPAPPAHSGSRSRTPVLTEGAIDRRLRRLMTPNSHGQYKVSDQVRRMYANMDEKSKVVKMFEGCDFDPEAFAKRYKFTVQQERESELEIPFEFLSKAEMSEHPYNMSEILGSLYMHTYVHVCIHV
ncbi:Zan [Symbiodinium sp. KB8]|nr:Zan [Symbiodinium sp. KB8]